MKTLSKLIFSVALLFTIGAFVSCKKADVAKSANTSTYYMRYKLNGEQKEYYGCGGKIIDTLIAGAAYGASIAGSPSDGSESMGLILYSTTPFASGMTFSDANISTISLPSGNLNFVGDSGNSSYSSLDLASPGVQVVLTELTSTYMKATFSGKMKEINGNGSLTVTDGELYAIRQY